MNKLRIDIVSDVICPWCYLGKRRLELALEALDGEIAADVVWHPFQLEPDAPAEGFDAFAHLAAKFGNPDSVRQAHVRLTGLGAEIGLVYDFQKTKIIPNTLDAHRLIHWAGQEGLEIQNALVNLLFKANFEDGLDVGNHDVLVRLAEEAGMDGKVVAKLLASDADRSEIRDEIGGMGKMGVSGVPFFIFENSYAISGAQGVDAFVSAMRDIVAIKQKASH